MRLSRRGRPPCSPAATTLNGWSMRGRSSFASIASGRASSTRSRPMSGSAISETNQARSRSSVADVADIVDGHEQDEAEQHRHTNQVDQRLALWADTLATPQHLDQHEEQTPAVQPWNRQQVEDRQIEAQEA